ncbi:MAG: polysaccharide deacetylase family protein [Candidatus Omnitrophica bacterium]|nr:polysaccharide deacetylase family protein [Candidatus Omnitrophota bacterium]
MKKITVKKLIFLSLASIVFIILAVGAFTVFFDQAVIVRRDTIYRIPSSEKAVALTFDDGPSPVWTPKILDVLKEARVKATFFMLGMHVQRYPDVARRVAEEGHEIGNHTYDHHGVFYYKPEELNREVGDAEKIIKSITGVKTKYFRPPKAWLTRKEKEQLKGMGYETVLWSLNSKDWVTFDDRYIVKYILRHVRPGDILLFHDSGGVFKPEGGKRKETVKAVSRLIEKLRERGYRFVTISELLKLQVKNEK